MFAKTTMPADDDQERMSSENRNQESTSNFADIQNFTSGSCVEQKFQQEMLLSHTTAAALALALAKHRQNGEKTRGQRKQVMVEEEPKLRRNRTAFNDSQLDKLERCFQSCQYPTVAIRDRLARETGLPESKIQVWYKNRRAKHRKHLRNLPADDASNDDPKVRPNEESPLNVISWDPQLLGHFYSLFPTSALPRLQ